MHLRSEVRKPVLSQKCRTISIDDDQLCTGSLTVVLGIDIDSAHNGDSLS